MSGNQTPNLNSPKVKSSSSNSSPFPGTTATTTTPFTPEMRSRQARGKDPYHSNSEDEMTWMPGYGSVEKAPTSGDAPPRQQAKKKTQSFAQLERQTIAEQILSSPELLTMSAIRDGETITATRIKYQKLLCGLTTSTSTSTTRPPIRPGSSSGSASGSSSRRVSGKK